MKLNLPLSAGKSKIILDGPSGFRIETLGLLQQLGISIIDSTRTVGADLLGRMRRASGATANLRGGPTSKASTNAQECGGLHTKPHCIWSQRCRSLGVCYQGFHADTAEVSSGRRRQGGLQAQPRTKYQQSPCSSTLKLARRHRQDITAFEGAVWERTNKTQAQEQEEENGNEGDLTFVRRYLRTCALPRHIFFQ